MIDCIGETEHVPLRHYKASKMPSCGSYCRSQLEEDAKKVVRLLGTSHKWIVITRGKPHPTWVYKIYERSPFYSIIAQYSFPVLVRVLRIALLKMILNLMSQHRA